MCKSCFFGEQYLLSLAWPLAVILPTDDPGWLESSFLPGSDGWIISVFHLRSKKFQPQVPVIHLSTLCHTCCLIFHKKCGLFHLRKGLHAPAELTEPSNHQPGPKKSFSPSLSHVSGTSLLTFPFLLHKPYLRSQVLPQDQCFLSSPVHHPPSRCHIFQQTLWLSAMASTTGGSSPKSPLWIPW